MLQLLLVSSIRFYRESLATILAGRGKLAALGTASDCGEALAQALKSRPDVVLLDAVVPAGREFVPELNAVLPETKVVVISIVETSDSVLEWAETGIAGYVSREQSVDDLITTIESVARGEFRCPPRITASMLQRIGFLAATSHPDRGSTAFGARLTPREYQIVKLINRGFSNKRIARELGISVSTAKNHVHNVLHKLKIERRTDAPALLQSPRAQPGSH